MAFNFMNALNSQALEPEYNQSITEKGAVGFRTTGDQLLDMNFKISSYRAMTYPEFASAIDDDIGKFVSKLTPDNFKEEFTLLIKWIFYVRDCRGGLGERRMFRKCIYSLIGHLENMMELGAFSDLISSIDLESFVEMIPEYGRWDDLISLIGVVYDTPGASPFAVELANAGLRIIKRTLDKDLHSDHPSLLAKWMPSENASSAATQRRARLMIKELFVTPKHYRRMLTQLRAKIKIVETQMSENKWDEISYESVPSKANLKYSNAFMRHDTDRRTKYIYNLSQGSAKVNAKVLAPYEIIYRVSRDLVNQDLYEAMWNELLNTHAQSDKRAIVVADQSGSMSWSTIDPKSNVTPSDVAQSLAIYLSDRLTGEFHNRFISFGSQPSIVDLNNLSLRIKVNMIKRYDSCGSTDIKKVFDLIRETGVKYHISQEDMPDSVVILSDMEFDSYHGPLTDCDEPLMRIIESEYKDAGYEMPEVIYWNLGSRTQTIPEIRGHIKLISGFSANLYEMVVDGEIDMKKSLMKILNGPRYDKISVDTLFI